MIERMSSKLAKIILYKNKIIFIFVYCFYENTDEL